MNGKFNLISRRAGVSNLLMRADTESQEKTLSTSIDYGNQLRCS
nr:MAG TPA: hypothetical protein [Caudoviricetes sp.]